MGGIGSGLRWGCGGATCDGLPALDVRRLARSGYLEPGVGGVLSWHRRGQVIAVVKYLAEDSCLSLSYDQPVAGCGYEQGTERVAFAWTRCHLGGKRVWFRCPGCGERRAILYHRAGRFRCRRCHGLSYSSQRESQPDRALRRARNIRVRLGGAADPTAPFPNRPKYMRQQNYDRVRARAEKLEAAWLCSMGAKAAHLGEQIRSKDERR